MKSLHSSKNRHKKFLAGRFGEIGFFTTPVRRYMNLFILRALQIFILSLPLSTAATIQTNYGTGDGTTPGGQFLTNGNLLTTSLASASRSGTFYREESGYIVSLGRLYDDALGPSGSSGLGSDGNYTVMPNQATIRFDLNGSYDIVAIRTYASWDDGRSGQGYTVQIATSANPTTFFALHTVVPFNNDESIFPVRESSDFETDETIFIPDTDLSSTMVALTSSSGILASDVVSIQFLFNGYQNGGTAFREFQVEGIPEPSVLLLAMTFVPFLLRRRRVIGS
jgi:hypothetical protein